MIKSVLTGSCFTCVNSFSFARVANAELVSRKTRPRAPGPSNRTFHSYSLLLPCVEGAAAISLPPATITTDRFAFTSIDSPSTTSSDVFSKQAQYQGELVKKNFFEYPLLNTSNKSLWDTTSRAPFERIRGEIENEDCASCPIV